MPIITVQMLTGRTPAHKSLFIERIAHATVAKLGVPEDAVRIVLNVIAPEDWGVGPRTMADLRSVDAADSPPG